MESFQSSGIVTKQAHVKIPQGLFEEEFARQGFFGKVAHLYHENPPVNWTHLEGELRPRCLPPVYADHLPKNLFMPLLSNNDAIISICYLTSSFSHFYRNADFDELLFIHDGNGKIETSFGPLDLIKGDYVLLPRGTTYKIFTQSFLKILKIESDSEYEQPDRGLLGPNALYDQTALKIPQAQKGSEQNLKEYKIEIKRCGEITLVTYPFNPLDCLGWKGSLYPYKLSIYDICPIMSHKYHIPPSGHTTFVSRGFVVCSFVERPLEDTKEGVLKVPFYHSNIDFDEVIFYHQGSFFSRDNIAPGCLTFHPQGIHHGPHPKAFNAVNDKTHTDEFAVMIDTKKPLIPSKWFNENQNQDYWKSWM